MLQAVLVAFGAAFVGTNFFTLTVVPAVVSVTTLVLAAATAAVGSRGYAQVTHQTINSISSAARPPLPCARSCGTS